MPIGYAPFSTIQQGNQQVVNSLASLGQQISGAIESHAQTQAAQAMLPALQQSYQQGMQKIASGDPNGMADIYSAAATASQIPVLQGFANHAVNTGNSAMIQTQHMARTRAYIGGRMAGLYGQYGSGLMNPPNGMNPNWQGKQSQTKAATLPQQMSALKNFQDVDAKLADQQASALRTGDQSTYNQIVQQRQAMRDTLSQGGMNVPQLSGNESQPFDNASQLKSLNSQLKAEQAKHTIFGLGGPDQKKIDSLTSKIKELQSSQLPSVMGSGSMGSGKWSNPNVPAVQGGSQSNGIDQVSLFNQAQKAINNGKDPNAVMKRAMDLGFDPDAYRSQLQKQQGATQGGPQSSINASGSQQIAGNSPESIDESEAVGGGAEENPSEEEA